MRISSFPVIADLSLATAVVAQEKKIQRADLPPAVEKTVAAQTQGATIKGFSQENEKGETYYEAETTVNGHSKDITIDANGALVEIEEQVARLEAEFEGYGQELAHFRSAEESARLAKLVKQGREEIAKLMREWEETTKVIEEQEADTG